jgi:archaemetzincin
VIAPGRRAAAPIAVQPLGEVAVDQVSLLERIFERAFAAPTVVLPSLRLPESAFVRERGQWDADQLLEMLFARLPERCLRVVGVTEADLFIQGRTFVFGYAHLADGMALYSVHRLRESFYGRLEDPRRTRTRVLRAVVHELGHTFGAPHCREACVMRSVSHVESLDELPASYCGGCRARVREGLTVEPWSVRGRFERASAFARRGEWPRCAAELEHAARCAPREPRLHRELAMARLAAGDRDGARAALRQAIEIEAAPAHDARAAAGR